MKIVTTQLWRKIQNMSRAELLNAYSRLDMFEWPHSLGKEPKQWDTAPEYRGGIINLLFPSRAVMKYEVQKEIVLEIGRREIKQIQLDATMYIMRK